MINFKFKKLSDFKLNDYPSLLLKIVLIIVLKQSFLTDILKSSKVSKRIYDNKFLKLP